MEDNNEKIKVILYGQDNMSDYNNCNVELYVNKEEWECGGYEDDPYCTGTPGGILELLGDTHMFGVNVCVLAERHGGIFDEKRNLHYEIIELETVNTPTTTEKLNFLEKDLNLEIIPERMRNLYKELQEKPDLVNSLPENFWEGNIPGTLDIEKHGVYDELNKVYYKKRLDNYPDSPEWSEMTEKEIEEFNNEYDYSDSKYCGFDIYTIKNFDLELELKTGYV